MGNPNKKISFKFDIILLVIAIVFGVIVLSANFVEPFLNQYVFVGLTALVALASAVLIAICIIIYRINNRKNDR